MPPPTALSVRSSCSVTCMQQGPPARHAQSHRHGGGTWPPCTQVPACVVCSRSSLTGCRGGTPVANRCNPCKCAVAKTDWDREASLAAPSEMLPQLAKRASRFAEVSDDGQQTSGTLSQHTRNVTTRRCSRDSARAALPGSQSAATLGVFLPSGRWRELLHPGLKASSTFDRESPFVPPDGGRPTAWVVSTAPHRTRTLVVGGPCAFPLTMASLPLGPRRGASIQSAAVQASYSQRFSWEPYRDAASRGCRRARTCPARSPAGSPGRGPRFSPSRSLVSFARPSLPAGNWTFGVRGPAALNRRN